MRSVAHADVNESVLADLIVERLNGPMISSSIPADIGAWIRKTAEHGSFWWQFSIPMTGATCIGTHWKLHPDGTMGLELTDSNGRIFWRGTFHPAEGETNGGS